MIQLINDLDFNICRKHREFHPPFIRNLMGQIKHSDKVVRAEVTFW